MDIIKKRFGEQLKTLRKLKNFTQESLAEQIGINQRQLARIEAGESFISSDTLYKICTTLNIPPKELFNFNCQKEELLNTETDNQVHFNVIKQDNIFKLEFSPDDNEQEPNTINSFDSRMLSLAQQLKKDIFVNEIEDGIKTCSKIYTTKGEIRISQNQQENNCFDTLKRNIQTIANDKRKLEYMNLAYHSLSSKESLNELKILIRGIELLQG